MQSKITPHKNKILATTKRTIDAVVEFTKPFSEIGTRTLPKSEPARERKKIDELKNKGRDSPLSKSFNSCDEMI